MKKIILIPALLLCACTNTTFDQQSNEQAMSTGAYMLNSVLGAATQIQQQREQTKQTESVMAPRTRAVENMGH